ncbi:MAG TPA: phosphoribosyltransferase family protein [Terriglobia bacterium]|nr:phosphoribosyltransferase family protein [Terriglobia bacterium]
MFRDRVDAGRRLAEALSEYKDQPVVVFALPRGGVVLGAEVARFLDAPLDLIVVRKIGHPNAPEYAIGAVAEDGYVLTNPDETKFIDLTWLNDAASAEWREAQRRRRLFVGARQCISAKDKIAILVDDGLATGLTMEAAIHEVRKRRPRSLVVAVPVAASETAAKIKRHVDELIVLQIPPLLQAIGAFYQDFAQVTDEEVITLMKSFSHPSSMTA